MNTPEREPDIVINASKKNWLNYDAKIWFKENVLVTYRDSFKKVVKVFNFNSRDYLICDEGYLKSVDEVIADSLSSENDPWHDAIMNYVIEKELLE